MSTLEFFSNMHNIDNNSIDTLDTLVKTKLIGFIASQINKALNKSEILDGVIEKSLGQQKIYTPKMFLPTESVLCQFV